MAEKIKINDLFDFSNVKTLEEFEQTLEAITKDLKTMQAVSDSLSKSLKKDFDTINKEAKKIENSLRGTTDIKEIQKYEKELNELTEKYKKQTAQLEKNEKANDKLKQSIDELKKARKNSNEQLSQQEKLEKKLTSILKGEQDEIIKLRTEINKVTKAKRDEIKATKEQTTATQKLQKQVAKAKKEAVELGVVYGKTSKQFLTAARRAQKLDAELKDLNRAVGTSQVDVGNYQKGWKSLGGAFSQFIPIAGGVTGAIAAVGLAIGKSFTLFKDFNLTLAKVQATSGATKEEFDDLKNLALELGESTKFSANDVAQLELELSKLGFSVQQVKDATPAILNFAAASDVELGRAAEVIASTTNAFGLLASDSQRVADVAAKAFASSALDVEKFATALGLVGPTAAAANVSVEETTAALGVLVDAGIDASSAATGLRKILAVSAKQGRNYKDVLKEVSKSTEGLKTASKLFGLTAQSQGVVLAKNIDKLNALTTSLNNAEGASKKAADIISNNLSGDLDSLNSKIEGLLLNQGALNTAFRFFVQSLSRLVVFVSDFAKTLKKVLEPAFNFIVEVFGKLGEALAKTKTEFSIINGIVDFIAFQFKNLTVIITILVRGFTFLVEVFNKLSNQSGFVGTALKTISNILGGLFDIIVKLPNAVLGFAFALKKAFDLALIEVKNFGKKFTDLFNAAVLSVTQLDASIFTKAIKDNFINVAKFNGEAVKKAFLEGYKKLDLTEVVKEDAKKVKEEVEKFGTTKTDQLDNKIEKLEGDIDKLEDKENKKKEDLTKVVEKEVELIEEKLDAQEELNENQIKFFNNPIVQGILEGIARRQTKEAEILEKQAALTEDEAEKQELLAKAAKEREKAELRILFIETLKAGLQAGKTPTEATQDAVLTTAGAKIAADIAGFHDGGYTGDGGEWTEAGVVHKGEMVQTKKQVDKYGMKGWSAKDFDTAINSGYFAKFAMTDQVPTVTAVNNFKIDYKLLGEEVGKQVAASIPKTDYRWIEKGLLKSNQKGKSIKNYEIKRTKWI